MSKEIVVYSIIFSHPCQDYHFYDREGNVIKIKAEINGEVRVQNSFSGYGLFGQPASVQEAWKEKLKEMVLDEACEYFSIRDVIDERGGKVDQILIDYWLHRGSLKEKYLGETCPEIFDWAKEALIDRRRWLGSSNSFAEACIGNMSNFISGMVSKLEERGEDDSSGETSQKS